MEPAKGMGLLENSFTKSGGIFDHNEVVYFYNSGLTTGQLGINAGKMVSQPLHDT
jgi:hypothetical protein